MEKIGEHAGTGVPEESVPPVIAPGAEPESGVSVIPQPEILEVQPMVIPIEPEVEVSEAPLPELQEARVPEAGVEAETLEAPPLKAQLESVVEVETFEALPLVVQSELAAETVVEPPVQGTNEDPLQEAGLKSIGSSGKAIEREQAGDANSQGDGSSPVPQPSNKRPREQEIGQPRKKVTRQVVGQSIASPTGSHGGSWVSDRPLPRPTILGSEISDFTRAERQAAKEYIHKTLQSLKAHLESIYEKGTGMG